MKQYHPLKQLHLFFLPHRGLGVLWVKGKKQGSCRHSHGSNHHMGMQVTSVSDIEEHDIRQGIDHCLCGIHSTTLAETSSFKRGKLVVVRELNLVQEGCRFNIYSQTLSKILNLSCLNEHPN